MNRFWLAAVLAVGLGSAAQAQETPDALLEAFITAISSEDASALAQLYTEDADSYGPGTDHVRGREAIAADWQGFFDAFDDIALVIEPHGSVDVDDTHAAWGVWTMTQTPAGGGEPFVLTGRFMDVQARIDGRWYYVADHASVSPAMAPVE
ncbi:nuclear transport factor 2 family protein [Maricaulis sp.]|uniref:YybH family protein n=1 Tax=Maricaulis sp. TaxID=1486257 RepID=UPI002B268543|nr:nuclear transport factor 2 family protein [Maricaulis sp.]